MTDKMREWPTGLFASRLQLPIMTKIFIKILLRYKNNSDPCIRKEFAKKIFVKKEIRKNRI